MFWRSAPSFDRITPFGLAPVALRFGIGALIQGVEYLTHVSRYQKCERVDGRFENRAQEIAVVIVFLPFFAMRHMLLGFYSMGRVYLSSECSNDVVHLCLMVIYSKYPGRNMRHISLT